MNHLRIPTTLLSAICSSLLLALSVDVQVSGYAICGQPLGIMYAFASGGTGPYSYQWSTGENTPQLTGLAAGTYQVTVTDAMGEIATGSGTIEIVNSYPYSTVVPGFSCIGDYPRFIFYAGTENGMPPPPGTPTQHGPGPYTFDPVGYNATWQELPDACSFYSYYDVTILGAAPGQFITVNYTDGSGCPGTFGIELPPSAGLPEMQVLSTTGSCTNSSIGSATISVGAGPMNSGFPIKLKHANGTFVGSPCNTYFTASETPSVITFNNLAPGTYYAMVSTDEFTMYGTLPPCRDSVQVVIEDLGATCGLVNGRLYVDANGNCALNGGENNVPNTVIEVTPGPYYTNTNSSGQFSITLPFGTYTFTEQHPVLEQSCAVTATVNSGTPMTRNVGCAPGDPLDLRLIMTAGVARPGFEMSHALTVTNLTPAATGTLTLTMTFDPILGFLSAQPAPTSIAGNTLTWTAPALSLMNAFQQSTVQVRFQVPPDVGLLGTELISTATIASANTDVDLSNNSASVSRIVTGAYDPNDKLAYSSLGSTSNWLLDEDEWIDYTIRFQNTGTDTAFNVVITDTLPPNLDPASIIVGAASHNFAWELRDAGTLKFYFPNILLPDSNINEPRSHGFVGFRIRPRLPLLPGDEITNIANIYFDFNPPVITEPSVLVAEFSTGVEEKPSTSIQLRPNPTEGNVTVQFDNDVFHGGAVRVMAADGRMLLTKRITTSSLDLDLDGLNRGIYLIECTTRDGHTITTRLVVQ
ncbi:MAG: T9SS type A sorting domain-containing protein [Flavobacteriales bacterium]|nr:T9SS type A sorting domain-containing protein [Flavobacteriales bacterium]